MVRNVLIVDDNSVVRRAVCHLFQNDAEFNVCGEAVNGQEAIEKALRLKPDLVVTDLSMPTMNGLEETRILKRLMPNVAIIIYTVHSGPSLENDLLSAGASFVISKSAASSILITKARSCFEQVA